MASANGGIAGAVPEQLPGNLHVPASSSGSWRGASYTPVGERQSSPGAGGGIMNVTRRHVVASLGTLAASAALNKLEASASGTRTPDPFRDSVLPEFPRRSDFNIVDGYSYLNGAFSHPMPRMAAEAYQRAVEQRTTLGPPGVPFVFLNPPPET